ncbi:hypothetical protein SASPL_129111 [Salvia splendens]|uniref:Uncharacterized protein n=1 Tax=Salvia splendens TaxID=180675 RepID=A0A8X8XDR4_SALSN|nr:uncharacterized protein LOC121750699 [Salvia splendens]KAG6411037.1 hypothetical protein SASPL_129111 [Salvia splendens]
MLLYGGATSTRCLMKRPFDRQVQLLLRKAPIFGLNFTAGNSLAAAITAAAAAALVLSAGAIEVAVPSQPEETLSNVPQTLSSVCGPEQKDCRKRYKIQRPKSKAAEACTSKCSSTCMQGGYGSPGEGPFNIRRPLVVFKEGFRSRKYCLSECSDICNLIRDGEDGP